ncbi:hypothetical protein [Chryseobacterium lathyri]|jgi:hypothetical protein|uniref:Uncharacterized protein n=1 Tax=Chryseobacterium lathyri TaxID=395933 RepID=A0A511YCX9_9FLAO|nr:hypothetical protein [Chryseobacterium lathyri]GEN73033.1 hypothetical protein CLA01_31050 [Chryseobacterium lathyri]
MSDTISLILFASLSIDKVLLKSLELIGTWQINKYGWLDEPEMTASNDKGYFIKFNADNTVEYKDTNTTFKGVDILLFSI